MWYIKETEEVKEILNDNVQKFPLILKKIIYIIKKKLCIVSIKEIDDKSICIIPFIRQNKINKKTAEKISKKVVKTLIKNNVKNVALSEHLHTIEILVNRIYSENINVLDGRWLFKYAIFDIVEYISKKSDKKLENLKVSILLNDKQEVDEQNIILLAKEVKSLNIVTNHIQEYTNLEDRLNEELGVMLSVSNNTKKSLQKSDVIINMDFSEEQLNKYTLPRNVVLVNIDGKINIATKKFNGININFYDIIIDEDIIKIFKEKNLYNAYNIVILYESLLYRKDNFKNIRADILADKMQIAGLIGNFGEINEEEYKNKDTQKLK